MTIYFPSDLDRTLWFEEIRVAGEQPIELVWNRRGFDGPVKYIIWRSNVAPLPAVPVEHYDRLLAIAFGRTERL